MARPRGLGSVEVDPRDLRRFTGDVRRQAGTLPRRIGEAHKRFGSKLVRSWLSPRPVASTVGSGAGADVRPEPSTGALDLLAGGPHRAGHVPEMQWGARPGRQPGTAAPKRPWLRGSIDSHHRDLEAEYLEAVSDAMSPAFYDTEP
jgi:hypothetical protein